jgi:acetyl esterase/lipase
MRAVIIPALLSLQHAAALHLNQGSSAGRPIDVGAIVARGHPDSAPMPTATPGSYVLGPTLERLHVNTENALLDGAPEEWKIFDGPAPLEQPGDADRQLLIPNDPTDKCSAGDRSGYSILNVSEPTLVPFVVPQGQANRLAAAVIVAPGGGDRFLSWTKEGTRVARWLNSIGISAFVLKYRVPHNTVETRPKGIIDAQRAVSFVRSRASRLGLNATSIGFMGFSAGAFLTADVATTVSRAYAPVDKVDVTSHLPDFALEIYGYGRPGTGMPPPTFVVVAQNDPCVPPEGALLYNAYLKATFPDTLNEMHIFADGHHGYGDCTVFVSGNTFEPVCGWTVNAQLFLEKVLGLHRSLGNQAMVAPPIA